jgi:hypothetical protein
MAPIYYCVGQVAKAGFSGLFQNVDFGGHGADFGEKHLAEDLPD